MTVLRIESEMAILSLLCAILLSFSLASTQYLPNWDSLDARPLPKWYDQAKVGIILHWGVYCVPSYGGGAAPGAFGSQGEWFWWEWRGEKLPWAVDFMQDNYPEGFTYPDFGPSFTAELFDPDEWAELFQAAGARWATVSIHISNGGHSHSCNT